MIYKSNVTASCLITSVSDDIAVFPAISMINYINWYNDVVQSIYKSIIKPCTLITVAAAKETERSGIDIPDNSVFPEGAQMYLTKNGIRRKLLRVDNERDLVFRDSVYIGEKIKINSDDITDAKLIIEVLTPPPIITEDNVSGTAVPFPTEYHDMIKARLKGEALKLCNQDNTAAKWLNDFNAALEDFKAFHYRTKSIV